VESKGKNFLIPLGANLGSEFELEDEALDANSVLRAMEEAGNPTNIMIMDACRDNPFARSWRSASRGLAQMNAPSGSFIAFATAPGSVAADGDGRNSPFTKNLLASLSQPDLDIDRVFTRVTAAVARDTARQQVPWKSSSLTGAFSFSGDLLVSAASPAPAPAPTPAPSPVAAIDPPVNDRVFWESVKDSRNPEELRAYLVQFPRGLFAPLASTRLRSLQASEATSVAAVRPLPDPAASLSAQDAYQQGKKLADESSPNRNDAEAVRLFRWAAERGLADAQVDLGFMYERGRGVARDFVEAVRLYRLAANQGNRAGQVSLGVMYENGRGVARDDVEAVRLYRLSADQGLARAQKNLGWMYQYGRGVPADDAEAVRLYRLAANQGDASGQVNLGWMYEKGRGVAKDLVEAVRLYRLAANQGQAVGQKNLGVMYELGLGGLPRDLSAAKNWYRLAARQGYQSAQTELKRLGETW
jgi:TPR repeat protein